MGSAWVGLGQHPTPPAASGFPCSPSGALSTVYQSLKRAECSFLSSSSSGRSRMSFSVCGGTGPRSQEGWWQGSPLVTLLTQRLVILSPMGHPLGQTPRSTDWQSSPDSRNPTLSSSHLGSGQKLQVKTFITNAVYKRFLTFWRNVPDIMGSGESRKQNLRWESSIMEQRRETRRKYAEIGIVIIPRGWFNTYNNDWFS